MSAHNRLTDILKCQLTTTCIVYNDYRADFLEFSEIGTVLSPSIWKSPITTCRLSLKSQWRADFQHANFLTTCRLSLTNADFLWQHSDFFWDVSHMRTFSEKSVTCRISLKHANFLWQHADFLWKMLSFPDNMQTFYDNVTTFSEKSVTCRLSNLQTFSDNMQTFSEKSVCM